MMVQELAEAASKHGSIRVLRKLAELLDPIESVPHTSAPKQTEAPDASSTGSITPEVVALTPPLTPRMATVVTSALHKFSEALPSTSNQPTTESKTRGFLTQEVHFLTLAHGCLCITKREYALVCPVVS